MDGKVEGVVDSGEGRARPQGSGERRHRQGGSQGQWWLLTCEKAGFEPLFFTLIQSFVTAITNGNLGG